jgi:hypothetical protein
MRKLIPVLIVVAGVLGYGYHHQRTHGSVSVLLNDPAQQASQRKIYKDEITFLDASGTTLAQAKTDDQSGVIRLIHPTVGDCLSEERAAMSVPGGQQKWQACFEQQSAWLMTWIRRTRYLSVTLESCPTRQLPITIRESGDTWWLWWMPLPHIGGKPYAYFSVSVTVDRTACSVAGAS